MARQLKLRLSERRKNPEDQWMGRRKAKFSKQLVVNDNRGSKHNFASLEKTEGGTVILPSGYPAVIQERKIATTRRRTKRDRRK